VDTRKTFGGETSWKIKKEIEDNIKVDFREIHCENGRWMELTLDCVQWWTSVFMLLKLEAVGES
jgi:hypothetical protein